MESSEAFKENAKKAADAETESGNADKKGTPENSSSPERVHSNSPKEITLDTASDRPLSEEANPISTETLSIQPHSVHHAPESPKEQSKEKDDDDDDHLNLDLTKSSQQHPAASISTNQRKPSAPTNDVGGDGVVRMHKFTLYETSNFFYIVGCDLLDSYFRILKIDRTADPNELNFSEDDIIYTRAETQNILNAVDEGNKATGGLKLKTAFWGVLGFIRFTGPYYMIYVTKRSQVAMIGGHYIYQIDKSEMIPLTTAAQAKAKIEKQAEESRFISILSNLDLSRSFYFSYSYDVTRTLQHNIIREREALQQGLQEPLTTDHNDMFVWNHHLLKPAKAKLKNTFDWCLAIIHGYVKQSGLSVYWGRIVYLTLIARRSRFFAGARFLKRGANDLGYVANDVETEQIVSEMLTTSFHAPGHRLYANPNYTSHVQHRGSIPLYWTQDPSGVTPKPEINLNVVDPFFSAAALHFDNLFQRYGTPIYCLNLIKSRERTPRETKLLKEYTLAISYLNQFLPEDKQILYHAWDMSRASKTRDGDVIGKLEAIAADIIPKTGLFTNGNDEESGLRLQNGVTRTNCIDCLDRTNAAQFVVAKKAFAYQLQALGVIEETNVDYDSDAINLFTEMWHEHGDTIAIQYGGSHLVNTMSTYRKIDRWSSQSRDMVESFKRFYNNSFMDAQRQEAYNLFLGNYVFAQGQPMLWDLSTDYYLHHSDPRSMFGKRRPSYRHWYTDEYLDPPKMPESYWPYEFANKPVSFFDDYWTEYYRPLALTSFQKHFSFRMNSNLGYIPVHGGKNDLSPFVARTRFAQDVDGDNKDKTQPVRRKGVKIIAPSDDTHAAITKDSSIDARLATVGTPAATTSTSTSTTTAQQAGDKTPKPSTLGPWVDAKTHHLPPTRRYTGIIKETSFQVASSTPTVPTLETSNASSNQSLQPTKQELATQAFTAMVASSLSPNVSETEEYRRYVDHPSTIPLVVSSDIDYAKTPTEFLDYLSRTQDPSSTHRGPDTISNFVDEDRGMVGLTLDERAEESLDVYVEFVESGRRDDPLTVFGDELEGVGRKRYKAYRQWLKGKSLFKQRLMVGEEVV